MAKPDAYAGTFEPSWLRATATSAGFSAMLGVEVGLVRAFGAAHPNDYEDETARADETEAEASAGGAAVVARNGITKPSAKLVALARVLMRLRGAVSLPQKDLSFFRQPFMAIACAPDAACPFVHEPRACGPDGPRFDSFWIAHTPSTLERSDPPIVVLYVHGGGFVSGDAAGFRGLCTLLSEAMGGAPVLLPQYRMPPEMCAIHESTEDVVTAYKYLAQRYPRSDIVVLGDSAGGCHALLLLQRLAAAHRRAAADGGASASEPPASDRAGAPPAGVVSAADVVLEAADVVLEAAAAEPVGGAGVGSASETESSGGAVAATTAAVAADDDDDAPPPRMPVACALISPVTDVSCSSPSFTRNADRAPCLEPAVTRWVLEQACHGDLSKGHRPDVSPVHGDCRGLPPTCIVASEDELFADDATRFAEAAAAAGVVVDLHLVRWAFHAFPLWFPFCEEARDYARMIAQFCVDACAANAAASAADGEAESAAAAAAAAEAGGDGAGPYIN